VLSITSTGRGVTVNRDAEGNVTGTTVEEG
jgi:hypothetical protein